MYTKTSLNQWNENDSADIDSNISNISSISISISSNNKTNQTQQNFTSRKKI